MIPGHTKFICDAFFSHIKKKYRNQIINIIDDIELVINNSSAGNKAILYNNGIGWTWYDFNLFFKNHFIKLPNLKTYYHFRFSSLPNDIGKVYISKKLNDREICFKLLDSDSFNKYKQLSIIPTAPITKERQEYLYSKIRQYVNESYKNIYCAKPANYNKK